MTPDLINGNTYTIVIEPTYPPSVVEIGRGHV